MRYTAKARMLSFDFLADDTVYRLPPEQVLVFTGMLARADNLGRLPGEPEVLLTYLFYPKRPRDDITVLHVEALLVALATAKPTIIVWYAVEGVSYVEFVRWSKHQAGIRPHNRKSSFPAPDVPGVVRVVLPGQTLDMLDPPSALPEMRGDVGALIRSVAGQASMQKALTGFDEARVKEWIRVEPMRSGPIGYVLRGIEWVKFARWLANTGTTNMNDVMRVLDECWRLQPRNPWAYFHPDANTRGMVEMQQTAKAADAVHNALKEEDKRKWGRNDAP